MSFIFLLFLFFTLLSFFPSDTSKCTGFDQTVAERQKAKMCRSDQKAFQVHFGNDGEDFQKERNASNE